MENAIQVVGWILWAFTLIFGVGSLASTPEDRVTGIQLRLQGVVLLMACAVTLFFPISKFWVLAAFPVAVLMPMLIAKVRFPDLDARIAALQGKSAVPGGSSVDSEQQDSEQQDAERVGADDAAGRDTT